MADREPERRDLSTVLADLRVSVAKIEQTQQGQAETLRRLENKLDLGVFREEYERRHHELQVEVDTVVRDYQQRTGREQVWKWVSGVAITIIGALAAAAATHVIP